MLVSYRLRESKIQDREGSENQPTGTFSSPRRTQGQPQSAMDSSSFPWPLPVLSSRRLPREARPGSPLRSQGPLPEMPPVSICPTSSENPSWRLPWSHLVDIACCPFFVSCLSPSTTACVAVVQGDFSTDGKWWWCSQGLWKQGCLLCDCPCLGSLCSWAGLVLKALSSMWKYPPKCDLQACVETVTSGQRSLAVGICFFIPVTIPQRWSLLTTFYPGCWVQGCEFLLQWVHSQAA